MQQSKATSLGSRTFRCSACRRIFNERTGTPFNSLECPTNIVLLVVFWRLKYKLSLRDLAEMFLQRGFVFTRRARSRLGSSFCPVYRGSTLDQARRTGRGNPGTAMKRTSASMESGALSIEPSIALATWLIPCSAQSETCKRRSASICASCRCGWSYSGAGDQRWA